MRTKNYVWNLIVLLMIPLVGLCVTSCSDDDDSNVGNKALVGTWVEKYSDFAVGIKLDNNGRAYYMEWDIDDIDLNEWDDEVSIRWSADDEVIRFEEDEDGDHYSEQTHYNISEDGKTLTLYRDEDDDEGNNYLPNGTYTRQK